MPDVFNSNSTSHQLKNKLHVESEPRATRNENQKHKIHKLEGETLNLPEGYDVHSHPDHTHQPVTSYCFYPDKVGYVNLDSQEKTILLLRKHPITNLPWILTAFVMAFVPFFFTLIPFYEVFPEGYKVITTASWYLFVTAFVIEKFLSWFFNVDLITDERIMDIDFVSLMYREITEANLDEIQEVTVKPATGIYSFFHFGTVYIQTAAERPRLEFINVPKAEKVAKILRELQIQEEIEQLEGRVR